MFQHNDSSLMAGWSGHGHEPVAPHHRAAVPPPAAGAHSSLQLRRTILVALPVPGILLEGLPHLQAPPPTAAALAFSLPPPHHYCRDFYPNQRHGSSGGGKGRPCGRRWGRRQRAAALTAVVLEAKGGGRGRRCWRRQRAAARTAVVPEVKGGARGRRWCRTQRKARTDDGVGGGKGQRHAWSCYWIG